MKIRTKILLSVGLTIIIIAVIGILFFFSFQAFKQAINKEKVLDKISTDLFGKRLLLDEYILHFEDRPREQYIIKNNQLIDFINSQVTIFSEEAEKKSLIKILSIIDSTRINFLKLTAIVEKINTLEPDGRQNLENQKSRLLNQLISQSQQANYETDQLQKIYSNELVNIQRSATYLVTSSLFFLLLIIIILSIASRKIINRISKLQKGTEIIGQGNLTYQIEIENNDEIGRLSQSFNQMATKLKDSHNTLEQKIQQKTENLDQTNKFLESIIENIPNMIFVKEAKDLQFTKFNKAGENLLGQKREDLIGKNDYNFFPKKEADFFTSKDREVLSHGKLLDIPEESIQTKNGLRLLHTKKIPILSDDGKPLYLLGISEDITEKKERKELIQKTKELEEIKAKDEATLSSIGDGLVAVGKDGNIFLINKAFERVTGWKESEVQGKFLSQIIPAIDKNGKIITETERLINRTLKNRESVKTIRADDLYYRRKDGSTFPVSLNISPIVIGSEFIGAIEIFRDISKEKEIDRAKSEFISLASHQLKTPPTAIKLLTERLLSGKIGRLTKKQKEYFTDVQTSNQRMIELVKALLDVSRLELGTFTLRLSKENPCSIIEDIIRENKLTIAKKHQVLKTILPKEKILIKLDKPMFSLIVTNLLINAIHYTAEKGQIKITGQITEPGQRFGGKLLKDRYFVFSVADTGYGIPHEEQKMIFARFYRATNIKEKNVNRTGLGLYIVKSILDHSGGLIWFTSQENKGSIFYVAIPLSGMTAKDEEKPLTDQQP